MTPAYLTTLANNAEVVRVYRDTTSDPHRPAWVVAHVITDVHGRVLYRRHLSTWPAEREALDAARDAARRYGVACVV